MTQDVTTLVDAAKAALSTLKYVRRELQGLSEVLPELMPVRRCCYAFAETPEQLEMALRPWVADEPVSDAQRAFIASIDKSIEFHRTNQNDPHGIGNAVIAALLEVKTATEIAYKAQCNEQEEAQ